MQLYTFCAYLVCTRTLYRGDLAFDKYWLNRILTQNVISSVGVLSILLEFRIWNFEQHGDGYINL